MIFYIKDLTKPDSELVTIVGHFDFETSVLDNQGSKLFLVTNHNAPNQRIVTVDAANPTPENWVDLIPETEHVLSPSTGGGYIFAEYMADAISIAFQYDYQGKKIRDIKLPGVGTLNSLGGKREETKLYYSFTNYKTPATIYAYDVNTGESEIYRKSGAAI